MTPQDVAAWGRALDVNLTRAIVGQRANVSRLAVALLAGGHVLLEGPPGTAKTLLARCFARAVGLDFGRIQFTPDLLPGDILGANLFNFQTSQFSLTRGPIFTELLLADEINRTPPKTQAALLQAMQERQVTLDGQTHALSPNFTVIATQNPIESQGVYPLPEAQLDRFLFKLAVPYPDAAGEARVVLAHSRGEAQPTPETLGVEQVSDGAALATLRRAVAEVTLAPDIADYIVALVRATRESAEIVSGVSPRAGAMLARAAAAQAALEGRGYVVPDDVQTLAPDLFRHRLMLSAAAEIDGRTSDAVVADIVASVAAPR